MEWPNNQALFVEGLGFASQVNFVYRSFPLDAAYFYREEGNKDMYNASVFLVSILIT